MAESETCMLLESLVTCDFLSGHEYIEPFPYMNYTLYKVHWNGQSLEVQFLSTLKSQNYLRLEVDNKGYRVSIGDLGMLKVIMNKKAVYDVLFEFITNTVDLAKYFKLRT
jgi:hypothetical protein